MNHHRMIFSLGQLRQTLNFDFISGKQEAEITQDNGAISYQYLLGKSWLNAAGVDAYISNTDSIKLADKNYTNDSASLYEVWSDPRRIAGGRTTGLQGRLLLTPSARTEIKLGLGGERLTYNYLMGNESSTRARGSVELLQRLNNGFNFRAAVNAAASQNRYALGLGKSFKEGSQLGMDITRIEGRDGLFNDTQLQLTYTQSLGSGNSGLAGSNLTGNPLSSSEGNTAASQINPNTSTWTSALVEQVARRPSFLPSQVLAKVDKTATPTRLIAINKTTIPAGSSVNQATGEVSAPLGINVSSIQGVTKNGGNFTNSGQFNVFDSILVVNPSLMTQPAVGITDKYVVTMINKTGGGTTVATVEVSHGSTKIDRITISAGEQKINAAIGVTAPVAGVAPVTSVTGTGYTGSVEWTPKVIGTFAYNEKYTATVKLTAATGYNLTDIKANYFTVIGATTTNPTGSGNVSTVFPAATLPPGYIRSGGFIWAPITTQADWNTASQTCKTSTALGYAASEWRQPTIDELSQLRGSGALSSTTGWTLGDTWSITPNDSIDNVSFHTSVSLANKSETSYNDGWPNAYVSCVYYLAK